MSWQSEIAYGVITPGVVAALVTIDVSVTGAAPRADLLLVGGGLTVDDADQLLRANRGSS
jgi:hypothetical protein